MSAGSKPNSKYQKWIDFLWGLSRISMFLIAFVFVLNWLDIFLHAPIGIKDNPPEPGVLVTFAQMAFWPVFACCVVLGFQKFCEVDPKKFVMWLAVLLLATLAAGWFITTSSPLFRGIDFLWKLVILGLAVWVAWLVVAGWLDAKQNRAIRAGSKDAFDERVEYYVGKLNYSLDDAIKATKRIRDGEPKGKPDS